MQPSAGNSLMSAGKSTAEIHLIGRGPTRPVRRRVVVGLGLKDGVWLHERSPRDPVRLQTVRFVVPPQVHSRLSGRSWPCRSMASPKRRQLRRDPTARKVGGSTRSVCALGHTEGRLDIGPRRLRPTACGNEQTPPVGAQKVPVRAVRGACKRSSAERRRPPADRHPRPSERTRLMLRRTKDLENHSIDTPEGRLGHVEDDRTGHRADRPVRA